MDKNGNRLLDDNLELKQEQGMIINSITPVNIKDKEFEFLMSIYQSALEQVYNELNLIKETSELYGNNIINNITKRIKTPSSIIDKMKNKQYDMNYKNLIENINDVAGIRVICPVKDNIYTMIDVIHKMKNIKVIKEKDYLSTQKESGYSGYHIIVETYVKIEEQEIPVKVEIQLRTMAMDFWATNEHKIKYKTNQKLSVIDSKRLIIYAKLLNFLDNRMSKIYERQKLTYSI